MKPSIEFVLRGISGEVLPEGPCVVLVKLGSCIYVQVYGLDLSWSERQELGESLNDCRSAFKLAAFARKFALKHEAAFYMSELKSLNSHMEYVGCLVPSDSKSRKDLGVSLQAAFASLCG